MAAFLRPVLLTLLLVGCGDVTSKPVDARVPDMAEMPPADAAVDAPPDAPTSYAVGGELTNVGVTGTAGTLTVQGNLSTSIGACAGTTCVHGQLVP